MPNDSKDNSQNSSEQGGGDKGSQDEHLYAGKYKTVEEMEKGYKEIEKNFHERPTRQDFQDLKELVETRLNPVEDEHEGGEYKTRENGDEGKETLAEMYRDPDAYFAKREKQMEERMEVKSQKKSSNDTAINTWLAENSDLNNPTGQALLGVYASREDGKLSVRKKLDNAAVHVRAQIAELRGKVADDQNSNAENHIEGPGSDGGERKSPITQQSAETELAKHVNQRKLDAQPRKPTG